MRWQQLQRRANRVNIIAGAAGMRLLWQRISEAASPLRSPGGGPSPLAASVVVADLPNDQAALVDQMIRSHRSALLLRPQLAEDLKPGLLRLAIDSLQASNSLVSAGRVRLSRWQVDAEARSETLEPNDCVEVEAVFLARRTITNQQFQAFVDQGGYRNKSLWHASIWPSVKEFVDRTGTPSPCFWSEGRHTATEAEHPVVGISWFEAEAYARWIGMRLPTDAEWVRAACTPIETDGTFSQRKYPWGDSFSPDRANLWTSTIGHTVSSCEYASGDTITGLRQMVGNVWEWTSSNLQLWNGDQPIELNEPMKSLRGGAFDSYLDTRATCQVRSADTPLARRHNIGFRCAVSQRDIITAAGQTNVVTSEQAICEASP